MKILLICANGLSTSILMNKMQKWGKEKNIELEVRELPAVVGAHMGVGGIGVQYIKKYVG